MAYWIIADFQSDAGSAVRYVNEHTTTLNDVSWTICPKKLRDTADPTPAKQFTTKAETKAYIASLRAYEDKNPFSRAKWDAYKMTDAFPQAYFIRVEGD